MTTEDKELLLRDLCARLPYGIICKCTYPVNNETTDGEDVLFTNDYEIEGISRVGAGFAGDRRWYKIRFDGEIYDIDDDGIKVVPYLRPMSSMTKEEILEFIQIGDSVLRIGERKSTCILSLEQMDWFNKNMFDYRGLIPMGLALEAPEDMYTDCKSKTH